MESKLVRLEAENIKRLSVVEIDVNGQPVICIGGRNGQGKSSTLDAIEYALGGKPSVSMPIRNGEKKARTVVETTDLIVTRTFTASGSQLKVTTKDGKPVASPQAMLDKLVGQLAFDPLAFSNMKAKEQAETLRGLVGLDFSVLDEERKQAFEDRTAVNREYKNLTAQAEGMPRHPDAPAEEVSIADLNEALETKMEENQQNERRRALLTESQKVCDAHRARIDQIKVQIRDLQEQLECEKEELHEDILGCALLEEEVADLKDHDLSGIREQIRNAEATNTAVRDNKRRMEILSQAEKKEAVSAELSRLITDIDATKERMLSESPMPVEGLSFDENGVTYNDIPFDQCSTAERLRVSVAMGLAQSPDLKLMLIRDGSSLDRDSLSMVKQMAEEAGATIMIERVGDGEEVQIVIEDGHVSEVREAVA